MPVLETAYAKYYGSYAALENGYVQHALTALTRRSAPAERAAPTSACSATGIAPKFPASSRLRSASRRKSDSSPCASGFAGSFASISPYEIVCVLPVCRPSRLALRPALGVRAWSCGARGAKKILAASNSRGGCRGGKSGAIAAVTKGNGLSHP